MVLCSNDEAADGINLTVTLVKARYTSDHSQTL